MEVLQIPPVRELYKGLIRQSLFLPKACLWLEVGGDMVEGVQYSLECKNWTYVTYGELDLEGFPESWQSMAVT